MLQAAPTIEAHGARIPLVGLGTWELRGSHLRAHRRAGAAARLSPHRHGRDVRQRARGRRGAARSGVGARTSSSPRKCGRRISRRANWSAPPRRAWRGCGSEVDLLLLHWPNPQIPLAETLGALCKVKRDGLARHIGVSNFTVALIEEAMRLSPRAAGLQPDRDASVSRPVEGGRGLPGARHGGHRLQPDRARQRQERCGACPHRQGAWQERGAGLPALAGAAEHRRSSRAPAGSSGWQKISRCSISQLTRRRDGRDRRRWRSRDGRIVDYAYSGSPKWD